MHSFLFFPQQPDWFFKKINQVTSLPAQNSSLNSHLLHRVHILPTVDKVIDDLNPAYLSSHSGLSVPQTYKIYFLPQGLCAYRFCPTPPILFTSWFHGFFLLHLDHCSNGFSPRIIPTTCFKDPPFPPISGCLTWFVSLDHVQVWIGGGFSCCSTVLIVHHIVTLTVTSHWQFEIVPGGSIYTMAKATKQSLPRQSLLDIYTSFLLTTWVQIMNLRVLVCLTQ